MAASGVSRANANRAIRQEALRESLAAGGHLQHVVDMTQKLADLDDSELDALEVTRLRAAIDAKLRLVAKYLPDLKSMELTGPDGEQLEVSLVRREIVDAKPDNPNG